MRFLACTLLVGQGIVFEYAWLNSHDPWHYAVSLLLGVVGNETIRAHWSDTATGE